MRKPKTKKNYLAKSKRKGRGIDASKLIPSKIPISREEILRLRRERKTLKRETKAAEKAKAEETREQDAIINRFLTDTEKTATRALRDAAREAQEKADELVALKEENSKLKTELAIYKKKEKAEKAEAEEAEARIINDMRGTYLETGWTAEHFEREMAAKEKYNIDMAIEAATKACDTFEIVYAGGGDSMEINAYRMAADVAGDKAIFLSAIKAIDLLEPQLIRKERRFFGMDAPGFQWKSIRRYLLRSIKWCDDITYSVDNRRYSKAPSLPALHLPAF